MRKWHKWAGLVLAFFFIVYALSGIFLNHRKEISCIDISRSCLPDSYRYNNWNNGALKGTFRLFPDSVLLYGGAGLFVTDSLGSQITHFEVGMKEGADNRMVGNIVRTRTNSVFAITPFDLYRLDEASGKWQLLSPELDTDERISDVQTVGDSLVVLSRSHVFISRYPYNRFSKIELKTPEGYRKEASLFRTMWTLHSGELFGLPGKIGVDLLGVISIVLCVTGVIFTCFPKIIKRKKKQKKDAKPYTTIWKKSVTLHNKAGTALLVFLLILVLSGTFLRPPLLIAIIRAKVPTVPGTVLNDDNPWFDKLRCIRYDRVENDWLLYSSEGFFRLDELGACPEKLQTPPPVSVMGVTVLEQETSGRWLAGSFSGLYYWERQTGKSLDAYTLEPASIQQGGRPVIKDAVSGYSEDFGNRKIIFDYFMGARGLKPDMSFVPMPATIKEDGKISLWHFCLEVHVGRFYSPVIGIFSDLFVFLSGVLILSVLLSGYIIYKRRYKKK